MEAVAKTGKPVVLCMLAGSDIDMSFAINILKQSCSFGILAPAEEMP